MMAWAEIIRASVYGPWGWGGGGEQFLFVFVICSCPLAWSSRMAIESNHERSRLIIPGRV